MIVSKPVQNHVASMFGVQCHLATKVSEVSVSRVVTEDACAVIGNKYANCSQAGCLHRVSSFLCQSRCSEGF